MTREEENEIMNQVQRQLEKMQGSDDDILFIESRCNRGVIQGSVEHLALMLAWNMAAYPAVRIIVELARKVFTEKQSEIEQIVKDEKPVHEIVDYYGNDFAAWIKNLEKQQEE